MQESKPKRDRTARRLTPEQRNESAKQRLARRVVVDGNGCWIWTGAVTHAGYGRIQMADGTGASRARVAHRVSYELYVGAVPEGLQLDHLCRVRACCNPEHLEPVTAKVNTWRSDLTAARINGTKTHCPRGHEFTDANTYRPPSKPNQRHCRACKHDEARRRRAADKALRAALAADRPSPYVTSAQVAKMAGVLPGTVRAWVRLGHIAPINRGCKPHLFEPNEILAFTAARRASIAIEGDAA